MKAIDEGTNRKTSSQIFPHRSLEYPQNVNIIRSGILKFHI